MTLEFQLVPPPSTQKCAIEPHPQGCSVLTPYKLEFVDDLKRTVPSSARSWDKGAKRWLVDISVVPLVAQLIEQHYGEQVAIPDLRASVQDSEQLEIKVEYIGTSRERDDGTRTASGFYNDGWNVIFPEAVLRTFFKDHEEKSGAQATYYDALGVDRKADAQAIKSAYRRRARQWHPDLCSEPDAAEQFQRIDFAYKLLADPLRKKKYDAGLAFEDSLTKRSSWRKKFSEDSYRTPLRSGLLFVSAHRQVGRFIVDEIHSWNDITDEQGRTHVASWPRGSDHFCVTWVGAMDDDDIPFTDVPF